MRVDACPIETNLRPYFSGPANRSHGHVAGSMRSGDRERHCGDGPPLRVTGIPAATKQTLSAARATAWLSRPAWSRKARAIALSGTMPRPTSFATSTTGPVRRRAIRAGLSGRRRRRVRGASGCRATRSGSRPAARSAACSPAQSPAPAPPAPRRYARPARDGPGGPRSGLPSRRRPVRRWRRRRTAPRPQVPATRRTGSFPSARPRAPASRRGGIRGRSPAMHRATDGNVRGEGRGPAFHPRLAARHRPRRAAPRRPPVPITGTACRPAGGPASGADHRPASPPARTRGSRTVSRRRPPAPRARGARDAPPAALPGRRRRRCL